MSEDKPISFTAAIRAHLSLPGESVTDLFGELKKLTPKDKQDLYEAFKAASINCLPPGEKAPS